jgi:hypothetical protein
MDKVQQDMPTTRNGIYATTGEGEQWLFLYEILLPTDIDWLQSNKTLPPTWRVLNTPGIHSLALIQEGHISWHWDVINGWNKTIYMKHTASQIDPPITMLEESEVEGNAMVYTSDDNDFYKPLRGLFAKSNRLSVQEIYESLDIPVKHGRIGLGSKIGHIILKYRLLTIIYRAPDDRIIWEWNITKGMTTRWASLVQELDIQPIPVTTPKDTKAEEVKKSINSRLVYTTIDCDLLKAITFLPYTQAPSRLYKVLNNPLVKGEEAFQKKLKQYINSNNVETIAYLTPDNSIVWRWDVQNGMTFKWLPSKFDTVTHNVQPLMEGVKNDSGKKDYTLLPWGALDEVVAVLAYGAEKYDRDNWQRVNKFRYGKALLRHVVAYCKGETLDPESGLHHLAHATCCCLFIIHQDTKQQTGGNDD